ncbi:MAG: DNA polymerase III subunit delta [Chitinophagales bacterium]
MDHKDLINEIKSRKFKPVYLLHGDESYYTDKIAEYMEENILSPEQKDFNCSIFYGKDANPQQIIDACTRFPMFAEHNLVILREAQMMKTKGSEIDKLEPYLENPSNSTILVICYKDGKFDARKKFFKLIKEKGLVYESESLKESEVPIFIENYLKRKKATADGKAISVLIDYLGTDLSKIINELEKLCINLKEGERITVDLIEKNIGISKDYNVFELQSALITKNVAQAFTIVNYMNDNSKANPFVLTVSNIHSAFTKLYHYLLGGDVNDWDMYKIYQIHSSQKNEYRAARNLYTVDRVEEIFELVLEFDLRSKGVYNVETSPEELLKELVYRILN